MVIHQNYILTGLFSFVTQFTGTMGNFRRTNAMVKGNLYGQMELYTRGTLWMVNVRAKEYMFLPMEESMKGCGKTVRVLQFSLFSSSPSSSLLSSLLFHRNVSLTFLLLFAILLSYLQQQENMMAKAHVHGKMVVVIMASGVLGWLTVRVARLILMVKFGTKVIGLTMNPSVSETWMQSFIETFHREI